MTKKRLKELWESKKLEGWWVQVEAWPGKHPLSPWRQVRTVLHQSTEGGFTLEGYAFGFGFWNIDDVKTCRKRLPRP